MLLIILIINVGRYNVINIIITSFCIFSNKNNEKYVLLLNI